MYIFTRIRTIDPGRDADAIAGGTDIAGFVSGVIDLDVHAWFTQFRPGGPALMWSTRFDTLEQLDNAWATLMADGEYHDRVAELDESFTGPIEDDLLQVVGGSPPKEPTPIVQLVQATAAPGHLRAAMHWGVDIAERFGRSLDVPTMFARSMYGRYGALTWGSYFEDAVAVEGTQSKFATDEMLQAAVDEGAHNCQPDAIAWTASKLT